MPLSLGQTLNNRYRIVNLLGQGGFGAVYKAWDANLGEPVALKESIESSPAAQKQFQLEAKLLFKLHHNSLPRVHDFFIVPGQGMYLVMDYIEGEDLESLRIKAGGRLAEAQVLLWIGQVCEALSYLHSQNPPVIHRDIKPTNIRITPNGSAMLVDFGIAKVFDPNLRTTLGARAVTPGYSPTEQYLSHGVTDARTDIYALGATTYTLLTGHIPPEAPERTLGVGLPAPLTVNPTISPRVEAAVLKAMEIDPNQRWQAAADFQAALRADHWGAFPAEVQPTSKIPYSPSEAEGENPPQGSIITRLSLREIALYAFLLALVVISLLWMKGKGFLGEKTATLTFTLQQSPSAVVETNIPTASYTPTPIPSAASTGTPVFTVTSTAAGPFVYTVEDDDTLWSIAQKFGVDLLTLIIINNLDASSPVVKTGQQLIIPGQDEQLPTATPIPSDLRSGTKIYYQVQRGDSLFSIANTFNSTVAAILQENKLENENSIYVGMVLNIPVNLVTPAPTATPTATKSSP
ncbi:MAG: LysM peptidoglycan-binding domain-containing protein [Anaerolineales bacterium]|nr:LysM peptidoglycan-binding domain-containing protein [Anaerolineales bacterium]